MKSNDSSTRPQPVPPVLHHRRPHGRVPKAIEVQVSTGIRNRQLSSSRGSSVSLCLVSLDFSLPRPMKRHASSRDSGSRPAQLHPLPIEKALSLSHATGRGASLFLRGIRIGQVGRAVPVPERRADRPSVAVGIRNPAVSGSEGRFRVRERFFYIRRRRGGVFAAAGRQRSGNAFMRRVRLKGTKRYSFIPSPISHADTSFRAFFAFSPQTARPSEWSNSDRAPRYPQRSCPDRFRRA